VFLLGGVGWLVTSFVGRPVRQFADLRGEIIERSVLYANVSALEQESPDGSVKQIALPDDEIERLREAQGVRSPHDYRRERHDRAMVIVWAVREPRPALEPNAIEIPQRGAALLLAATL
jgi:hypothetical protein